jgi:flagellar basal-body rod protein FlgF
MGSVIDTASAIMSRSERQVEIAGQNIANIATPGYKRILSFDRVMGGRAARVDSTSSGSITSDFTPGKLVDSGRVFDLALAGPGFFVVGSGTDVVYTRQGQFDRDTDGRLVNGEGLSLQVEGGGDLRLKSDNVKVLRDGTVLDDGSPVGKLAVVDLDPAAARPVDGGGYTAADTAATPLDRPAVYQGMTEASNVSMGAEMVSIMGALRRAETGQRLVTVYDDLMARVLQSMAPSS